MANDDTITIYHNPRCAKSRETLAIIQERGIEPTIIEYLKAPPTKDELRSILNKLGWSENYFNAVRSQCVLRREAARTFDFQR